METLLTRQEANTRFGARGYALGRCARCRKLYLSRKPGPSPIGQQCACAGIIGLTTWGKSVAQVLR